MEMKIFTNALALIDAAKKIRYKYIGLDFFKFTDAKANNIGCRYG